MAPELYKADEKDKCGLPVDIWAIGVSTYELLTGHSPFDPHSLNMEYDICNREPDYSTIESSSAKDFI